MQAPPEKLGSFYLGSEYDLATAKRTDVPVNYDARDLTTHAVCVGMTGSGKTGLCIGLLEEAALDRVPAILIDPKGDITNLLLQFPDLSPENFRTWINVDDARRKGLTDEEYAKATADNWRNGLADWGITSQRIRDLQATADYTIFTPGSDAGIPISILGSLASPKIDFDSDAEALRERIAGTVAALLGLVGINADPVRSREAILLSNIFEFFWRDNQDVDLAELILSIQTPPVRKLGVFDVDTFYPEKDRFTLAMAFNNLIAAPSFQAWLQGEPLDVDKLFFTADGKPRHSIFYIAHLSDSERMFFVTLLLENVLTWVRRQSGTTSLRALLYFDEIFGYFPPTAEPPSKRPLLTLIKQARAFGLGVVLVTQNPVDIDYKGLTNAGTWLIGKLQAERDKERVLSGLKGAISESGGNAEVDYDSLIGKLGNRVFLMHNVHAGKPIVFQTRWAQSYLRGPLTRPQVKILMEEKRAALSAATQPATPSPVRKAAPAAGVAPQAEAAPSPSAPTPVPIDLSGTAAPVGFSAAPPTIDPGVTQVYLPLVASDQVALRYLSQEARQPVKPESVQLIYEPALLGAASIRFLDRKRQVDQKMDKLLLTPLHENVGGIEWDEAETLTIQVRDLRKQAEQLDQNQGPFFGNAPEQANRASKLDKIRADLADWLYYNTKLSVQSHPELGLYQNPDERERDFKIRLQQVARERRDLEVDKLERQFTTQLERLEDRLNREEVDLQTAQSEHSSRKTQEIIGIGETILGWVLGRRSVRGLSQAANQRRMTSRAGGRIEESQQEIEDLKQEIADLQTQIKQQTDDITMKWANLMDEVAAEELTPRRADVDVQMVALAWLPSWQIHYNDGGMTRSATIAAYQLPAVG